MLERLAFKILIQRTSQRVKRTSAARVMVSFGRSIARSLGRSIDRTIARSLDRSIACSLARSLGCSLDRSVAHSVTRSLARSLARSPARSRARSLAPPLRQSYALRPLEALVKCDSHMFLPQARRGLGYQERTCKKSHGYMTVKLIGSKSKTVSCTGECVKWVSRARTHMEERRIQRKQNDKNCSTSSCI